MSERPLWTVEAMAAAMRAAARRVRCRSSFRASRSTPARSRPARRSSRSRATTATATNSSPLRSRPAPGLRWSPPTARDRFHQDAPLLVVADVLDGLRDLARAARGALAGENRRRHRLGRQDRNQGGAAAGASSATARPTLRPPPTTIIGACRCRSRAVPQSARYAVFEIGMNHAGEIEPLARLVRPHVAIVTAIEPVHLEFFGSVEAIADAKAEIFLGLEPAVRR